MKLAVAGHFRRVGNHKVVDRLAVPSLTTPLRQTPRKKQVMAILRSRGEALSAPEIHKIAAVDGPPLSLATVYRALSAFVADGQVFRSIDPDRTVRYASGRPQSEILLRVPGGSATRAIAIPELEDVVREAARNEGVTVLRFKLDILGAYDG